MKVFIEHVSRTLCTLYKINITISDGQHDYNVIYKFESSPQAIYIFIYICRKINIALCSLLVLLDFADETSEFYVVIKCLIAPW